MLSNKKIILSKISLFFALPVLVFNAGGPAKAQTTLEIVQHNLNTYFTKDHSVKNYVSLTKDSLLLYSNNQAKAKKEKPEFALSWKQVKGLSAFIDKLSEKELQNLLSMKKDSMDFYMAKYMTNSILLQALPGVSLKGMKIAIDPGHIGGSYNMANIERRCMKLQVGPTNNPDTIQLIEGNLTFFTAILLKKKLEAQGAEVMLTRRDTGVSSIGVSYYQWKEKIKNREFIDSLIGLGIINEKEMHYLESKDKETDRINFERTLGHIDLAERAKKINAFHPDITVIIHYNVNERNLGWEHPSDRDFVMTFVGGCIAGKDMETVSERLNFLRLLISPDIENSVKLSSAVVQHLSSSLNVPVAHKEDAVYLAHNCIATKKEGVYSRDLALTRLIRSTLVYGEPLYQDNVNECELLTKKDDTADGYTFSKRIELVADSYYKGILDYLASMQKK